MRWTVGAKIGAGFALALAILLVVGGVSYSSNRKLSQTANWVAHTHLVLEKLERVISLVKDGETGQRGYVLTGQESYLEPYNGTLEATEKTVEELRVLTADNQEQQDRIKKLKPRIKEKFDFMQQTVARRRSQGLDAAISLVLSDQGKKSMDSIRNIIGDMRDAELKLLDKRSQDAADTARNTAYTILLGTALAFVLVMFAGFAITRDIATPLGQITGVAEKIALGDLTASVSNKQRADEVGALAQAFTRMNHSLQEMANVAQQMAEGDLSVQVHPRSEKDDLGNSFCLMTRSLQEMASVAQKIAEGDLSVQTAPRSEKDALGIAFSRMTKSLRSMAEIAQKMAVGDLTVQVTPQSERDILGRAFADMVESLQRVVTDIAEAAKVLGASASEISASTTQLAASSTQTASAVSETTTTVEEIRQTAQLATKKARQVADSAQHASDVARTGRKATGETAAGMQRIHEQMEAIAEGMVRLSEQGQAIGQIIASVDDLAQQSNLLAVNASIEAAKAGDQGKGFAVVAQEVKSLADQSKQATMQVRAILTEIQKATSAAVLATEQGSKAVEAGVAQADQAGEAIEALAESVDDAAQAASQIAATSQQQLVGMDQVAQAMESIKQASEQNVTGARQLEEAARDLTALGHRLRQQVERFKI